MTNGTNLASADRRWAPPPYALAQLLTGKPIDRPDALRWLGKTMATRAELLFAPDVRHPTLLDVLVNPRFKPRRYESVDAVMQAAIADWGPEDASQRRALLKMTDAIRSAVAPERMELVVSLLLSPEADLKGAPGAANAASTQTFHYIDYGDRQIGGSFAVDPVSFLDPQQLCWSDCYLISALIALCWVDPEGMRQRLTASVQTRNVAPKRFHAWTPFDLLSGQAAARVEADCELPFTAEREPLFTLSTQAGEFWPAMMEKLYLLVISSLAQDLAPGGPSRRRYRKLNFGWPHKACATLIGGRIGGAEANLSSTLRNGDPITRQQLLAASGKTAIPTMAWTLNPTSDDPDERNRYQALRAQYEANFISHTHAYAVLGRMEEAGNRFVVLREPRCDPIPDPRPASYSAAQAWSLPAGTRPLDQVPLNDKGVFALREDVFDALFAGIGWVVPAA